MTSSRVITCSDGASHGSRVDRSGPAVRAKLEEAGFTVDQIVIVPDQVGRIASAIVEATGSGIRLIVTTGGTGISPRDVTPEATLSVCGKVVPGLGERMRAASLASTPMASLSRSQAAVLDRSLIVNLPGSPRGAVENLEAILNVIPHALALLAGETEHDHD